MAELQPHARVITALEFRELLDGWLVEFVDDWTQRQHVDPVAYPPKLSVEMWWDDFCEAMRNKAVSS